MWIRVPFLCSIFHISGHVCKYNYLFVHTCWVWLAKFYVFIVVHNFVQYILFHQKKKHMMENRPSRSQTSCVCGTITPLAPSKSRKFLNVTYPKHPASQTPWPKDVWEVPYDWLWLMGLDRHRKERKIKPLPPPRSRRLHNRPNWFWSGRSVGPVSQSVSQKSPTLPNYELSSLS